MCKNAGLLLTCWRLLCWKRCGKYNICVWDNIVLERYFASVLLLSEHFLSMAGFRIELCWRASWSSNMNFALLLPTTCSLKSTVASSRVCLDFRRRSDLYTPGRGFTEQRRFSQMYVRGMLSGRIYLLTTCPSVCSISRTTFTIRLF